MIHAGASRQPAEMPVLIQVERGRVEEALARVVAERVEELGGELRAAVEYALETSGKRLRPILCVTAYAAARGGEDIPDAAYRLACAVELVHTYSLVHDDLPCMDDDDLRRGRKTVHRVFGNAMAALAGAALLPIAIDVLEVEGETLGLDTQDRASLVLELAEAAGATGMVGGQLLDLMAEGRRVSAGALETIHRRKTGALLTASLRIGALAGGASAELLDALTRYGRALGLAFQIADDLLDVEGSAADLGKVAGRDVVMEKASYPALYGVDGARALARATAEEAKAAVGAHNLPVLAALADFVVERRK